jgi:D-serine deaminase-like pyridoxal phosphate-dependent protein
VGVDSAAGAEALAAAAPGARVLVEIDSGQHRSGVPVSQVTALATGCRALGLDVIGAFTHPGHAYGQPDPAAVAAAAADERAALAAAGAALEGLTDEAPVLSGGSTPTAEAGVAAPLTEVRPGTYVFGDRQQMQLAGLSENDIALVVAARVVSAPRPGEAVLDCGSKALSSDRPGWLKGYGFILEAPGATIVMLSEEHAVVHGLTAPLRVGDLVRVIPNHVCTVVNLASELLTADGGRLTGRWQVRARH